MSLFRCALFSRPLAAKLVGIKPVPRGDGVKMMVRWGSGAPRMMRYRMLVGAQHKRFKKLVFYYFLVGAVPAALIIGYTTIFEGDAVLCDHDPDLYEPDYWEYYKHPLTRLLAKYMMEDPKLSYYKEIYTIEKNQRVERQKRLINQVEALQALEGMGAFPLHDDPALPRYLVDDLEEFGEAHGFQESEPKY
uniref:NADH dehydrogenase [ubiquinone] 1 beta subcomplex subunit 5, mitochondrial n=1 Tax=Ciona savignyi TaxID=51511 RepID=H2ZF93_CIOSA